MFLSKHLYQNLGHVNIPTPQLLLGKQTISKHQPFPAAVARSSAGPRYVCSAGEYALLPRFSSSFSSPLLLLHPQMPALSWELLFSHSHAKHQTLPYPSSPTPFPTHSSLDCCWLRQPNCVSRCPADPEDNCSTPLPAESSWAIIPTVTNVPVNLNDQVLWYPLTSSSPSSQRCSSSQQRFLKGWILLKHHQIGQNSSAWWAGEATQQREGSPQTASPPTARSFPKDFDF